MTMKERLEVHRKIEAENKRKLKEWKEGKSHVIHSEASVEQEAVSCSA